MKTETENHTAVETEHIWTHITIYKTSFANFISILRHIKLPEYHNAIGDRKCNLLRKLNS